MQQRYSTSLFFNLGSRWDVGDQCHAPVTLPPGKRVGTHCVGGWVGPKSVWTVAENLAQTGIRSGTVELVGNFLKIELHEERSHLLFIVIQQNTLPIQYTYRYALFYIIFSSIYFMVSHLVSSFNVHRLKFLVFTDSPVC